MERDYYAVLGVSREAEDVVIRAAYKALAQLHHPDKMPMHERERAHERMAALNEAFGVLGDPARRREYDARWQPHGEGSETAEGGEQRAQVSGVGRLAQAGIICASVLLACLVAVDEKSWWQWGWDFLASGFSDNSHYVVDWPTLLWLVALGCEAARRAGRRFGV